jgi:Rrf2 family protein
MLSNKAKYGLKALIYLASNFDRPVQSAEVAEAQDIPKKFLDAILLDLKNDGILLSKKGRGGGYQLASPPERILAGRIIRVLDGPIAPLPCVSKTAYRRCDDCRNENACKVRALMADVRDAISAVIDTRSLADLADQPGAATLILQYDI